MEQLLLQRMGKPLVMFFITFLAGKYVTGSVGDGFLLALLPLGLGVIGVMQSIGYYVTAFSVLVAVGFGLMPIPVKSDVRMAFTGMESSVAAGVDDTADAGTAKPGPAH
jgi:hypothetical protein